MLSIARAIPTPYFDLELRELSLVVASKRRLFKI
jgi:hypothetical protein